MVKVLATKAPAKRGKAKLTKNVAPGPLAAEATIVAETAIQHEPTPPVAPAPQPAVQPPPAVKAEKAKAEKAVSLSCRLKEIVVREPKISSVDALFDQLVKEGFIGRSKVTIATLKS